MSPLVLLVCVGVVAVGADLAGVTVTDGDCLCVVGTGVNARDRPSGACSAREKELACELLRNPKIGLARVHPSGKTDNAYAYNNLRDMCNGLKASRSSYSCSECATGAPGGTVCLSEKVLEYLATLAQKYDDVYVTELAGACHSCSSLHYSGKAVDLRIPGTRAQRQGYLDTCKT
ncbi:hypothetical protein C0Q70_02602 [Pomacea canaliculata]|uniref:Uncharacterized protein n=1 Tax=Pomacea canaliculata TaxID=400727 RepID=A0A2T7PQE0_POMCA|nr:hypothetical protein C0Q70_02602 [Pomacea canaliculata]